MSLVVPAAQRSSTPPVTAFTRKPSGGRAAVSSGGRGSVVYPARCSEDEQRDEDGGGAVAVADLARAKRAQAFLQRFTPDVPPGEQRRAMAVFGTLRISVTSAPKRSL